MRLDDPLTKELVAIAELATVQDVKAAWAKFCGHYDGQFLPSVNGKWQQWCVNEAGRERTERERARERESREKGSGVRLARPAPAPMSDERVKQLLESGGKG